MVSGVEVRPDQVSVGVLVTSVPRDAVDAAVPRCGVGAKRSDGKLPPHVAGLGVALQDPALGGLSSTSRCSVAADAAVGRGGSRC